MKLSIVIPAYNEESYLPRTLEALKNALANISDAEIIVVDNESTDATREIAADHGAKIVDELEHNIWPCSQYGRTVNDSAFVCNCGQVCPCSIRSFLQRCGSLAEVPGHFPPLRPLAIPPLAGEE